MSAFRSCMGVGGGGGERMGVEERRWVWRRGWGRGWGRGDGGGGGGKGIDIRMVAN